MYFPLLKKIICAKLILKFIEKKSEVRILIVGEKIMALIKCPECGTEVSSLAEKCPKCAYPLYSVSLGKGEMSPKQLKEFLNACVGLAFVGFIIVLFFNSSGWKIVGWLSMIIGIVGVFGITIALVIYHFIKKQSQTKR